MTVYVDDMKANFGRMVMCHMIADTEEELHAMAARIGVARKWYQGDHYDIALSKRQMAIVFGAREITWPQAGAMMAIRRETGVLGDPATALDIRRAVFAARREARLAKRESEHG